MSSPTLEGGYRILVDGESILCTDEYWNYSFKRWQTVPENSVGDVFNSKKHVIHRRKAGQPKSSESEERAIVGEGYRKLEPGEQILAGDEFRHNCQWEVSGKIGRVVKSGDVYRRKFDHRLPSLELLPAVQGNQYQFEVVRDIATTLEMMGEGQVVRIEIRKTTDALFDWRSSRTMPCGPSELAGEMEAVYRSKPKHQALPSELKTKQDNQPPYSAPFTTDVPHCCGDPETCNDPCEPLVGYLYPLGDGYVLKFDPLRTGNQWTAIGPNGRIGDYADKESALNAIDAELKPAHPFKRRDWVVCVDANDDLVQDKLYRVALIHQSTITLRCDTKQRDASRFRKAKQDEVNKFYASKPLEQPSFNASGSKYLREIKLTPERKVDVYAVLLAFNVTCPARQHAIKKLLCSGIRGKGDTLQDLKEARDAIDRAIQLEQV